MFNQTYPQMPTQTNMNWIPVNGVQGVREYIVQANNKGWFMDNNEPIFYVKACDGMGNSDIKAFKFEEIPLDYAEPKYLTLADLEEFKNSLLSELKSKKETVRDDG